MPEPTQLFIETGLQYYTAARFAMEAKLLPVCGNLFHHAAEMVLKGGLSKTKSLEDVKRMGHNLDKVWSNFKMAFPIARAVEHDVTVAGLNAFEKIRYPDDMVNNGASVVAQYAPYFPKPMHHPGFVQYELVVDDIDGLIADAMTASGASAKAFLSGSTQLCRDTIGHLNTRYPFFLE